MCSPLIQNVNISLEICANVFGSLMDPYKDLNGSVYGSYMDLYVDLIWVVYLLMCSQLTQNVDISLEICANLLGGVWRSLMDPYRDPT